MVVVVDFSNIFPTVLRALDKKNWTWGEVATGHLAGNKAGIAFSKNHNEAGLIKASGRIFDSYKLYKQADSMGLFKNHPGLVKPIRYGFIFMGCVNLWVSASKTIPAFFNSKSVCGSYYKTKNVIWNYSPHINALGTSAAMVFDFYKHPIQTTTFFVSGAITLADRAAKLFPQSVSSLCRKSLWISRANKFWNGSTTEQAMIGLKALMAYRK